MSACLRRVVVAAVLCAAFWGHSAGAALSRKELAGVGFHLVPGTHLPAEAVLQGRDGATTLGAALDGKPALVTFTDYRCQSLCGVVVDQLATLADRLHLTLGRDYNVISLALDSRQTVEDARSFWERHAGSSPLQEGGRPFALNAASLAKIESSVGLVAPFDTEHGQFAHPAGLVLVDAQGNAQRIISPFAINPFDLRLALTETGAGRSLIGHALLLCYGFNPTSGLYSLRIERVLTIAAGLTVALIVVGVLCFLRYERRRAAKA